MANTKKVSEITVSDIVNYLRLYEVSETDENFIKNCIEIAKQYIRNYTGLEDLDNDTDFVIVVYLLCQDMYDTRTINIDNDKLNTVFKTILGFHRFNLLWLMTLLKMRANTDIK